MDGISDAGSVLAIDHDRLFKELLTTFFAEFLDLFFHKVAQSLERDSIEFLPQEVFTDLLEGDAYHLDLVAKAKYRDKDAFFLIHVEHQSTTPSGFPRRFFAYYMALFQRYGLPVYPIVVYSHERPLKAQPNVFRVAFADGEVLRFHYRVVQLNRLPWRRFVNAPNPVASALMAKMKIAPRDRAKVKAECLRLMVTLKLDRARMRLIASFVDTYLNLSDVEERSFQRVLGKANLMREERKEVVDIVTSWERRGIEKGRQEGIMAGREEGRLAGREEGREEGLMAGRVGTLRDVLVEILVSRFGQLDAAILARVNEMAGIEELRELTRRALHANSLDELGL